jgi:hypothetical protein
LQSKGYWSFVLHPKNGDDIGYNLAVEIAVFANGIYFFSTRGDCMSSKRIFSFIFMIAFATISVLVLSNVGNAQGRYANVYSKNQVSAIIKRAEDSSDKFRTDFRRQMNNNNNLSGSQKAQFNGNVADCEQALDRLRSRFNSENTWWNTRNQVQDVINSSQNVNTMMNVLPFRQNLERQWNQLRNDINTLADTYDLPGLNGGGWNGGGPGFPGNPGGPGWGGGQTSRPPSWAVGTWYWMNGPDRTMTIASNGRITLVTGGRTTYGRYYQNRIHLDANQSTLTRNGNNIRTYNQNSGETSDYGRNPWNGGPVFPGNPGGGNTSRPPSWAVGTWVWANGPDRTMTISSNGQVTLYTAGRTSYGTYYNGVITLDGLPSTVSRSGNRIRTYNQGSGETSDYRRQ